MDLAAVIKEIVDKAVAKEREACAKIAIDLIWDHADAVNVSKAIMRREERPERVVSNASTRT